MKKFFLAGLLGLGLMAGFGSTTAKAAVWRGGHPAHVASRPIYRTPIVRHDYVARPYVYNHGYNRFADRYYETPVYSGWNAGLYNRCW